MSVTGTPAVYSFLGQASDNPVYYQVTNFGRCVYLWVGTREGRMGDLSMAAMTPADSSKLPTTTKIIGKVGDNTAETLAARLSKRLGKQVLLSLNLNFPPQSPSWGDMEQDLFEEIKLRPHHFL